MIHALLDRRLSAQVQAGRPLVYLGGADEALDRPAHARAASSLVRVGGRLAAIQDDAHFIALIDPDTLEVQPLTLPAGPDGRRQFDDLRGTKQLKLDLEAGVVVPSDQGELLLAFGSGSTANRERILVVRGVADEQPEIRLIDANALYAGLRAATTFAGSELNVEGAVLVGNVLRLFQRGNGAPQGELLPVDASCDLDWPMLAAYLNNPAGHAPPLPEAITQYKLGALGGARLTFTDATPCPGGLLYSAAAELSPDATRDGPVVGSALGVLLADGTPRYAPLSGPDGQLLPVKVEGVLLDAHDLQLAYLVADADDPLVPSELLTVRLAGPWFEA